jgi:hypothetical protein
MVPDYCVIFHGVAWAGGDTRLTYTGPEVHKLADSVLMSVHDPDFAVGGGAGISTCYRSRNAAATTHFWRTDVAQVR